MTINKKWIWITFSKEGIHRYPEAETNPKLAAVSYLQFPHRHVFHFKVYLEVNHDNRDVEFILFKRELEDLYTYGDKTLELDYKSCEMIASDLIEYISKKYPNRDIKVDVSEDNENGAILEYSAK